MPLEIVIESELEEDRRVTLQPNGSDAAGVAGLRLRRLVEGEEGAD